MPGFWTTLEETNTYPPPSQLDSSEPPGELYRRLTERMLYELPAPLPNPWFDEISAASMGRLVTAAFRALQGPTPVVAAVDEVPAPRNAAAHLTQAAIGWFALPILRRMRSEVFRSLNRTDPTAEHRESIADTLLRCLGQRPLLSLRDEEIFCECDPPDLMGTEDLRRWILGRLASPCASEAVARRRAATIQTLDPVGMRETLYLWSKRLGPEPILNEPDRELLRAFVSLLDSNRWPPTLAPSLRAQAIGLEKDDDGQP